MLTVSGIFVYPVKSLGGISLRSAALSDRGFQHDRRWMLVDENNNFLSQRKIARMALLKMSFEEDGLTVYPLQQPENSLFIPFQPGDNKTPVRVTVWDDVCQAFYVGKEIDDWFSDFLSLRCRLVFMPEDSHRLVEPDYGATSDLTSFTDGYPLMVIGQSSLDDLNSRLDDPLPMDRFRPSLVISGGDPFIEDKMAEFSIGNVLFYGVKLSSRCVVTTIDQQNGKMGKEPLKTLSKYRRKNNKIYFGQNLLYKGIGTIKVGDKITVHQFKESLFGQEEKSF